MIEKVRNARARAVNSPLLSSKMSAAKLRSEGAKNDLYGNNVQKACGYDNGSLAKIKMAC